MLADFLANQPIEDYGSMQCEFPDEDIMALFSNDQSPKDEEWILLFDGASNALGHGIGAILISPGGETIPFTAKLCFDCTNNMVEYGARAMGIQAALDSEVKYLTVYGDLTLMIHQLKGEWETWDTKLVPYHKHIKELSEHFMEITFHHIPRKDNQIADALAMLSSMFKVNDNDQTYVIKIENRDT